MTVYNLTLVGSSYQYRMRQYSPSRSLKISIFIEVRQLLSLAMIATESSEWLNLDIFIQDTLNLDTYWSRITYFLNMCHNPHELSYISYDLMWKEVGGWCNDDISLLVLIFHLVTSIIRQHPAYLPCPPDSWPNPWLKGKGNKRCNGCTAQQMPV